MRKHLSKPVLAVAAVALLAGGLTPVLASTGASVQTTSESSAAPGDETGQGAFLTLEQESKDQTTYIKGTVADDVTKVELSIPGGSKIEVTNFTNHSFTVSIPAVISATPQYVTLNAYAGDRLVGTDQLRVDSKTAQGTGAVLRTTGQIDEAKGEVKVNGLVADRTDQVFVTYNGEKKAVRPQKLWDGVKAFSVSFQRSASAAREAIVETYADGQKTDTKTVPLVTVHAPTDQPFAIAGTAAISPGSKTVWVKGSISAKGSVDMSKLKLVVTAPDGQKHELKPSDEGMFETSLTYHDRSYSAKAVHVELYIDGKLVAQTNIVHGKSVKLPAPVAKPRPEKKQDRVVPFKTEHKDKQEKYKKGKGRGKDRGERDDD